MIVSIHADKGAQPSISFISDSGEDSALIKVADKGSEPVAVSSDHASHTSVEFNFDSADAETVRKASAAAGGIRPVSTSIREGSTVATAKKLANMLYDGPVKLVPLGDSEKFILECYRESSNTAPYVKYTFSRSKTPQDSNPLEYKQKWKLNPFRNARNADLDLTSLPKDVLPGRDRVFRKFCDHFSNEYERVLFEARRFVPVDSVFVQIKRSSKTKRDFVVLGDRDCKFELYVNELDSTQVVLDQGKVRPFFKGCEVEKTTPASVTLGEITVNTLFGSTWITCSRKPDLGVSATPYAAYNPNFLTGMGGLREREIERDINGVWKSRYASGDLDAGVNRREFETMDDKETQDKLEDICHWLWKKTTDVREALRT